MRINIKRWPSPNRFAFGITDDPDQSKLHRVQKIYTFCERLGIYPTRGTWVTPPVRRCGIVNQGLPDDGVTLECDEYLEWCRAYQSRGGEIALHGISSGDNTRDEVRNGLEQFKELLGSSPRSIFFHKHNAENLYWGESFTTSKLKKFLVRSLVPTNHERYEGHEPESRFFCGDLTRESIEYTRLFRTTSLNVLRKSPSMPFHIPAKPFVKFWFHASAQDLEICKKVTPKSLDRVARQDGLVLLYSHLSENFLDEHHQIHPIAKTALERVGSRQDCWKVGVSEILDRCLGIKNLVVTKHRNGIVVANPTRIDLHDVQIESSRNVFLSNGEELKKNEIGFYVIPHISANSCVALYPTASAAEIGDPAGSPRLGILRMQYEEIKRLILMRKHYKGLEQSFVSEEDLVNRSERKKQLLSNSIEV